MAIFRLQILAGIGSNELEDEHADIALGTVYILQSTVVHISFPKVSIFL